MKVTDKQLQRIDEAIDQKIRQVYKDKKLPRKTQVLNSPDYISNLEKHTIAIANKMKSLARSRAKSNLYEDYDALRESILATVGREYLPDDVVNDLLSEVMVNFEDQAFSLGIEDITDERFVEQVKTLKDLFGNQDKISLTDLIDSKGKLKQIQAEVQQLSIKSKEDPDDSPSFHDNSDDDADSSGQGIEENSKLYQDMNLAYIENFLKSVIMITKNRISGIGAIKDSIKLHKNTLNSLTNNNIIESMVEKVHHIDNDRVDAELHFQIEKNVGIVDRLLRGKRNPVTIILHVSLKIHRDRENKNNKEKKLRVAPAKSFDITVRISSPDIPLSANKVSEENLGSLVPAEKAAVEKLIIPSFSVIIQSKGLD